MPGGAHLVECGRMARTAVSVQRASYSGPVLNRCLPRESGLRANWSCSLRIALRHSFISPRPSRARRRMSSRVSRGLGLGATSTAFSLRAGGRGPISKAKDRTAGCQAHDHAFRPRGARAPAGPGPARAPAKFPVRRGTGRGKPRGGPGNSLFGKEKQGTAERPGGAGAQFPVQQGRTGNSEAAHEDSGNDRGHSGKPGGSGAPPGRSTPPPCRSPRWPKLAGPASPGAACRRCRGAGPRPPRRARRPGPARSAG